MRVTGSMSNEVSDDARRRAIHRRFCRIDEAERAGLREIAEHLAQHEVRREGEQ